MEKLMMLQLNKAIENPSAESLFKPEEPKIHTPIPRPHPFFLFCDKNYKPHLDQHLCPKHCTSSASHLPVIVVNKRCIYAACDNFEQSSDKIKNYIHGQRGDDADFNDDHVYTFSVPVKVTSSQQLLELKLESSLMQIFQNETPNARKLPIECVCGPYCSCSSLEARQWPFHEKEKLTKHVSKSSLLSILSGNKIEARYEELLHEREPKWESYIDYVTPKTCKCVGIANKHLQDHIPPYMKNMSNFESPDLLNYEICPLNALRKLVKKAKAKRLAPEPVKILEPERQETGTQYSDDEFQQLCNCFSNEELQKFCDEIVHSWKLKDKDEKQFKLIGSEISRSHMGKSIVSFVTERAHSLRNLIDGEPVLEEIFKKQDCD